VAFIDDHRREVVEGTELGVEPICAALKDTGAQIAPSTYYARHARPPAARTLRDEVLTEEIKQVHEANYEVFGARKMHIVLNREPDTRGRGHVARCTVERLMRAAGLQGVRRVKAPNTTWSAPREHCPADLVDRHFAAFRANELWVADITYVHTFTGWVYVAFVTDVFNREIVGWQVSRSLHTDLALDALRMGIYQRTRDGDDLSGLVHHSDRGVQYRSIRYGQALAEQDAVASVGSKGDSYDNALAEALNSLYKAELIRNRGPWTGIDDVEIATAEWVHWFNTFRPHSALGGLTPTAFRATHPHGQPAPSEPVTEPANAR